MKKLIFMVILMMIAVIPMSASATLLNVANLYGTATSNGNYSIQYPGLAIDGIVSGESQWVAPDQGTSSNPNWLTIDLGSILNVDSINLFFQPKDGAYHSYTTIFRVYYGDDNISWTQYASGTFIDDEIAPFDEMDRESRYSFGPLGQDMRFVKYEVYGGTHWSSISEIEIFSDVNDDMAPVPEPTTMMLFGIGLLGLAGVSRHKN